LARRVVIALALAPVVACSGLAVDAGAASPPSPLAAFEACLKQHGVTFGRSGAASRTKTRAAFKACAGKLPAGVAVGGRSPAFQKYAACMSKHGVVLQPGTRPNTSSATFEAASKACASLRPKFSRRPPQGA
jgi:hypothetical protein